MPRYFLHTTFGTVTLTDLNGCEFPTDDAAIQEASETAAELLSDAVRRGNEAKGFITVCDDANRTVGNVDFSGTVERRPKPA